GDAGSVSQNGDSPVRLPFTPIELTYTNRRTPLAAARLAMLIVPSTLIRLNSASEAYGEPAGTCARFAKWTTTCAPRRNGKSSSVAAKSTAYTDSHPPPISLDLPRTTAVTRFRSSGTSRATTDAPTNPAAPVTTTERLIG